jgi:hypothetical protein
MLSFWSEDLTADLAGAVGQTLVLLGEEPVACPAAPSVEAFRSPERDLRVRWIDRVLHESPDLAERRWAGPT